MEREEIIAGICRKCKTDIPMLDEKIAIAWDDMARDRCPLWMTSTNLSEEIAEVIEDYCDDYELDADDFDPEEDIFCNL